MEYSYATKDYEKENMARVVGRSLPISTKFSIEVCSFIRGKKLNEARNQLKEVIEGKRAIPFTRFKRDLSHKRNVGPGRYPKKTVKEVIGLLNAVEANAQFKGLNTSDLYIAHICAHMASRPWHYGRKRRRKSKRTHIEMIVQEKKRSDEEKAKK